MIVLLAIITLILVVSLAISSFATPDISAIGDIPTVLGAHRGSSVLFIENTLEAFELAVKDPQYKFIEIDIQYTKDKKIVVFHDLNLERLQEKEHFIEELTYEELLAVSDFHIPLYEEVMDLIGKTKKINIEIKSQFNLEDDQQLVDFVIADCERRGISGMILLSSVSKDVVKYIKTAYPHLEAGKIYWRLRSTYIHLDSFTEHLYQEIDEMGADYVMLHGSNILNYASLSKLKPEDVHIVFWYFDDKMYFVGDNNFV